MYGGYQFNREARTFLQGDLAFSSSWLSGHSGDDRVDQSSVAQVQPVPTV